MAKPIILCISHGATEEVFLEELFSEWKAFKFKETKITNNKEFVEEPKIIFFNDKTKIQSNEIKKRVAEKISDLSFVGKYKNEIYNIKNKEYELYIVVIMDINEVKTSAENDTRLTKEKDFIDSIITEAIDTSNLENNEKESIKQKIISTLFIYNNKSIEIPFDNLDGGNNKKPSRMRSWMRKHDWTSTKEIEKLFSSGKFANLEQTNIKELFILFEKIMRIYIEYLEDS